jgi:thiol-disulfide isomerase/thioredoxin
MNRLPRGDRVVLLHGFPITEFAMRLFKCLPAVLLATGLTIAAAPLSWAATEIAPFTPQAFEASQKQGKPILVQITASWCPICAKQRPILSRLEADPRFKNLVVYNIDFDAQKDQVRAMGAQKQSTLIVFDGTTEKGRSTGETDPAAIESLLAKSAE